MNNPTFCQDPNMIQETGLYISKANREKHGVGSPTLMSRFLLYKLCKQNDLHKKGKET